MPRRRQHVPWIAAGSASEAEHSADDVVRGTGWVFNNRTGGQLSLAKFVNTGDHETIAYLQAFDLLTDAAATATIVIRTSPTASRLIGRALARRSRSEVKNAAE